MQMQIQLCKEIGVPVATRTTPPPKLDETAQAALIAKAAARGPEIIAPSSCRKPEPRAVPNDVGCSNSRISPPDFPANNFGLGWCEDQGVMGDIRQVFQVPSAPHDSRFRMRGRFNRRWPISCAIISPKICSALARREISPLACACNCRCERSLSCHRRRIPIVGRDR